MTSDPHLLHGLCEHARKRWYRLPVQLTRPIDFWWSWGTETRYLRILWWTVRVWRAPGAPYEVRRALRDD